MEVSTFGLPKNDLLRANIRFYVSYSDSMREPMYPATPFPHYVLGDGKMLSNHKERIIRTPRINMPFVNGQQTRLLLC